MTDTSLFRSTADLEPFLFRITDNRGATADRYTVLFCDGDALALSETGSGVSMWVENADPQVLEESVESGACADLSIFDLDPDLVRHILARANEAFGDVMADPGRHAGLGRDRVDENEGLHDSAGRGLYTRDGSLYVRREGDAENDLGPYRDFRDAFLATLPEAYSLAGPEYQSTAF